MQMNVSMSMLLRISRKQLLSVFEDSLNQPVIPVVTQYRYLGVTPTNELTRMAHITEICSSAFSKPCFLRRKIKDTPSNIKPLGYYTFIRPKLEYACALWDPHIKKDIGQLENIQRKAVCFISRKYRRYEVIPALMVNKQIRLLGHVER